MLQLKPLDPSVPIFQQLNTDVSPVVLVNVFQVAEGRHSGPSQGLGSGRQLDEATARLYLDAVASGHCGQHRVHELRGLGVRRSFSGGVHPSRIQEGPGALPAFSRGIAPSFHATHGAESVCWSIGRTA